MSLKKKAMTEMSWSVLIQLSNQVFGFIITIVLARLLIPADFGVVGIIAIFIGFGRIFIDGGMGTSLIRNKEVTQVDYSTVFFSNFFMSVVLYALLFVSAPYIASFFEYKNLELLLKVYGVVFVISSFATVQSIRLNKNLKFKTQFKLLLPSLIVSAVVGIWMAKTGYGVWSLVIKEIVFVLLMTIQLWFYSGWRPAFIFDKNVFKYHFDFGYKLMLTDFIKRIFNDSNKVVIGKFFSPTQLGLFTRAQSMQELPTSILFNAFNRVVFPLLAQINSDDLKLKEVYRKLVVAISFVVIPLLLFLGIFARPLFLLLLTEKWDAAVPYFQILVLGGIFAPLRTYNLNICKVKGRSDMVLKLTIVECFLLAMSLLLVIWFGIYGLLYGLVVVNIVLAIITGYFSGQLINYTLKEQLKDILPTFSLSIATVSIAYCLDLFLLDMGFNNLSRLIAGAVTAFSVYITAAYLLNFSSLKELLIIVGKRKIKA